MAATQYSYRQYAGNGSTTSFAVPFPYLLKSHVRVYLGYNLLDGTYTLELAETTGYTWTSGTAIQTVAAPAAGQILTVIRQTPNSQQLVEWQDGSTLISTDLNTSDLQNLYVVQEQQDRNDTGITQSTAAKTTATAATTTANTASTNASTAVSTANTANTNSAAAVSTANTASTNASAAVTTANTASTNASTALSTANTALTNSSTATTTANNAVTTANTANAKADSAINAVASSVSYTPIGNVAGIPSTPADGTYIEVADSTGLESFTPLVGKPAGFIGDAGLSVRLGYTSSSATWNWLNYYANNSDTRYLKLSGGTMAGALILSSGRVTGNLEIGDTASLTFDGSVANSFKTTIAVVNPTAARVITLPDTTGNFVTTGDTGSVTSTMIQDGTIANADVSPSAAIAGTKIDPSFGSQAVSTTGAISGSNISSAGNVTGSSASCSGNAATATKLQSGRTISLTGDVTGTSASFDGLGNASITATVVDNSHNHATTSLSDVGGGSYTPTLTNTTNLTSSSVGAGDFYYIRVGTTVHVSGKVTITATTANTLFQLRVTLPVARGSNFTGGSAAAGCGSDDTAAVTARVASVISTQLVTIDGRSTANTAKIVGVSFCYNL
jgi:hypothetical protein